MRIEYTLAISLYLTMMVGSAFGAIPAKLKYRSTDAGITFFMDRANIEAGVLPRADCIYDVNYTLPLQKVPGGYLLTVHPEMATTYGSEVVMLYTKGDLPQGVMLGGYVYPVGTFNYTTLAGYPHTVLAFRAFPADADVTALQPLSYLRTAAQ